MLRRSGPQPDGLESLPDANDNGKDLTQFHSSSEDVRGAWHLEPPMLSIGKIHALNKGYYEQQIASGNDDYYAGKGESPGEWTGSAAKSVGLEGKISRDDFMALMEARAPDGRQLIDGNPGGAKVLAYDLTFSAPKSVSMLYALGSRDQVVAVRDAHDQAVGAALGYLEDEACQLRRGAGGTERIKANGYISAAYRHRFSRAGDPQLHTHVVTANLGEDSEGRFTRLFGQPLYRYAKTAGYLYQAELRKALKERLPWISFTEVTKGAAEIKGLDDPDFSRAFSRRRVEIEELGKELGRTHDRRSMAQIALKTRPAKPRIHDDWRHHARVRAEEFEIDTEHLRSMEANPSQSTPAATEQELGEALAGPEGLTEMRNTFTEREVLAAFAAAASEGKSVDEIRSQAERFLERPEVRELGAQEPRYSTKELMSHEGAIVGSVERRQNESQPWVSNATFDRVTHERATQLSEDQRGALYALSQSTHGVESVQALAGSGKTTLAGALREAFEAEGVNVVGAAPTGRAARELRERAGLTYAQTLDRLLTDLEREGDFGSSKTLLIVDEASMAHTRKLSHIMARAEEEGVKVVLIGDSGQLPAVGAGGALRSITERFGSHELREVMRQQDATERRLLAEVHDGRPERYLEHKLRTGELQVVEGRETAERATLERWWSRRQGLEAGEEAVMICRDNASRASLNHEARWILRQAGELGIDTIAFENRGFAVGDRVIARRNDRTQDIDNGTRATVVAVGCTGVQVRLDAGGERLLPPDYSASHLEHAYALTGHGAQGGTVKAVEVLGSPEDFTQNWSYTALSRGQEPTGITVIEEANRTDARRAELAPDAPNTPATIERMTRTMRIRDDEDLALDYAEPALMSDPEAIAERAQPSGLATLSDAELRRQLEESAKPRVSQRLTDARAAERQASRARNMLQQRVNEARRARLGRRPGAPSDTSIAADERKLGEAEALAERWRRDLARLEAAEPRDNPRDTSRQEKLERELARRASECVQSALLAPEQHIQRALGDAPLDPAKRRVWEQGVEAIESYRFRHAVTGPDALAAEPRDVGAAQDWRRVQFQLEGVQRELGRELGRSVEHSIGLSL